MKFKNQFNMTRYQILFILNFILDLGQSHHDSIIYQGKVQKTDLYKPDSVVVVRIKIYWGTRRKTGEKKRHRGSLFANYCKANK